MMENMVGTPPLLPHACAGVLLVCAWLLRGAIIIITMGGYHMYVCIYNWCLESQEMC